MSYMNFYIWYWPGTSLQWNYLLYMSIEYIDLKGQCHEIFNLWFFSWISFFQATEHTIRAVSNFSKIRGDIRFSRFTTGVVDTGGKLKKSSLSRSSSLQSIWSLILFPLFATGVVDTGGAPWLANISAGYSGAGWKLIHEKNQKQTISWHCPFKDIVQPKKRGV